ncbi:phosphoglycerate dehydrogenase [Salinisphaera sp.]|uniref:phosphoglycerate dehydrogenase n=1 Tax=Salinisphaera sp. TaxID=1914330 RepID=UPI002D769CEF|nr:phosphoglycerate dehydrogenase [Salinisphaera sp.]HET7314418.1 phosphoglycerate dehydrogenase [Salinisphaera sp.]
MTARILVTPRSLTRAPNAELKRLEDLGYEIVYTRAGQTPGEDELLAAVPGVVGWIAGVEPISTRVIDAAVDLKVISRNGSGMDNVPIDHAERHGIRVRRVSGGNARGVAELAITLIMNLLRHVSYSNQAIKQARWERLIGMEIVDRTIGVIGCGAIGQELSRIALALGARVLAYDPAPQHGLSPRGAFRWTDLDTVLSDADAITLHCPQPADGRPLIDRAALSRMKTGARLVNTARAGLVDEQAVLEALDRNRLGGFATDVFDREPPELSPLLSHDRVVTTAHIGAYTHESVANTTRMAIDNALAVLREPVVSVS